ncbi:dihydrofolate reductase-like isoform X2 [Condylostylus longicornis]|uniref:dihydrofolate reductase-like isoform X2 n=1 Tax=Condylostylus longicornis TaxID=2530218 RepID=UPI00244DA4D6|nr:dihydrofolate reductase-like isoform X2 [Condylostylus longicornis]
MELNIIAAVCKNGGIGLNGALPWNLKNDLLHFRNLTMFTNDPLKKNALIMGRKTYFAIPENKRPLSARINVILSRTINQSKISKDVILCSTMEEAINRFSQEDFKNLVENVWVIGGSSVYREAMDSPFCNRLYLTQIKADFECDAFFPPISKKFKIVKDINIKTGIQEENGIEYEFVVFEKERK